ncbi:serine-rich adhesin for platelets-like isoform X1 [Toxotes jaculatrix]|uniref:serine-rich adhesin for platelets-like isoform X1 n=1 Tax=Toxotes jaculatrix TaxID=941984 RepID=UPI001B3A8A60|nr:serine-rich adhesin for platelets-like isoform X1 [Toxotes jaculatrix]
MAPSSLSDMRMRNLLVGVILGLLAVVHTTPTVKTVTQNPIKAEDEVLKEAITDGFLVNNYVPPSLTNETTKTDTADLKSQQPSPDSEDTPAREVIEESVNSGYFQHGDDNYAHTTQSVSHAQSRDGGMLEERPATSSGVITSFNTASSTSTAAPRLFTDSEGSGLSEETITATSSSAVLFGRKAPRLFADSEGSGLSKETITTTSSSAVLFGRKSPRLFTDSEGSGLGSVSSDETITATSSSAVLLGRKAPRLFADSEGSGLSKETTTATSTSTAAPQLFTESEGSGLSEETITATSSPDVLLGRKAPRLFAGGQGSESRSGSSDETTTATSTSTAAPRLFTESEGSGLSKETMTETSSSDVLFGRNAPRLFAGGQGSESRSGSSDDHNTEESVNPASPQNKAHSTAAPGWIIILGFIVGVAALVMLCVAIATREKWNGPKQASQPETRTGSSNQQRELEMETFLHKDKPIENGKAAEYTVIPLDELPENYSSH